MEIKEVLNSLSSYRDGKPFKISTTGSIALSAKTKKDGHFAYKESTMKVVTGVGYRNRESVKKKLEEGYELSSKLPWGEWSEEPEEQNLIINHKGNKYLRVYLEDIPETIYYVDGKELTYDELKSTGLVNASYFKSGETPDALTININNIISIN